MDLGNLPLTPLISLIAGIVILIMPRLLNYIVAIYLIVIGLLGLFPQLLRRADTTVVCRSHPGQDLQHGSAPRQLRGHLYKGEGGNAPGS